RRSGTVGRPCHNKDLRSAKWHGLPTVPQQALPPNRKRRRWSLVIEDELAAVKQGPEYIGHRAVVALRRRAGARGGAGVLDVARQPRQLLRGRPARHGRQ